MKSRSSSAKSQQKLGKKGLLRRNLSRFDSSAATLEFSDQYLSVGTWLPSANVYGIGEDAAPLKRSLNNVTHTLWAAGFGYEKVAVF